MKFSTAGHIRKYRATTSPCSPVRATKKKWYFLLSFSFCIWLVFSFSIDLFSFCCPFLSFFLVHFCSFWFHFFNLTRASLLRPTCFTLPSFYHLLDVTSYNTYLTSCIGCRFRGARHHAGTSEKALFSYKQTSYSIRYCILCSWVHYRFPKDPLIFLRFFVFVFGS